jgi:glycosyltransferase involved in cell wall biosynthesis
MNIRHALESLSGWAGEIWVVDSHSTDQTAVIAAEYTDRIIQFEYRGTGAKKMNWSLENLPFAHEWVLILNGDERIPGRLAEEIHAATAGSQADGYLLARDYVFEGRVLRCFGRNWSLRLFKHRMGRFERLATNTPATGDVEVHEHVVLAGRTRRLAAPMLHEDLRPLRVWVDNHNRYSEWEVAVYRQFESEAVPWSDLLALNPVRRRRALRRLWVRLPMRPLARFLLFYLLRLGFMDGRPGLHYSRLMAYHEFMIGLKQRECARLGAQIRSPSEASSASQ